MSLKSFPGRCRARAMGESTLAFVAGTRQFLNPLLAAEQLCLGKLELLFGKHT
jgi:hypothetical protein